MSVDKIDLEALRVEASPEVTLLNLEDYKVLPTDKIERPKPLLSIVEGNHKKDLLKLSSVSLLYGQEKSRKSTFLRAIVQGVIKGYNEKLKCEFKDVDACIIDTEQNRDEIQFSLQSIKYLSGRYIDYYSFVELAFKDKMALTEQYLDNHPNTKLLIIDNLSDFLSDFNSNVESQLVFNWLLGIANKYEIHIITVMHQNSSGESKKPTGFLGTIALRKSNLVMRIEEKHDTDNTSLIECYRARGKKFKKFKLTVDGFGNPYLYDLSPMELEDITPQKVTRY